MPYGPHDNVNAPFKGSRFNPQPVEFSGRDGSGGSEKSAMTEIGVHEGTSTNAQKGVIIDRDGFNSKNS